MIRQTKYFLALCCLIALGVILYRFSKLESIPSLTTKTKIYSFNIGEDAVTIKQAGHERQNVKWNKDSSVDDNTMQELPPNKATAVEIDKQKNNKLNRQPTLYQTTNKITTPLLTTLKATEAPVVTLPPLTKAATTKNMVLLTTSKLPTTVVNVKPGDPPLCSPEGEKLVGPLRVDQSVPATEDNIEDDWDVKGWVEKGGAWRPTKCQAVSKVAIVIPYRKREQQLKIFLRHMHPMLQRQLLDYRIMVIEQSGETPFNRAMLFNIGYKEALNFHDFKCFVFHDVDLIPENDKNYYGCPTAPRHLSVAIDKFQYRLPYQAIFGGAGAFRKEDFEKINGFSNQFWGWGGEDDDLYRRITAKGFKLTRPGMAVGRYKMVRIFHQSAKADPLRFQKLKDSQTRMAYDGLNSLKYRVESVIERPLYTKVTVDINPAGL